MLMFKERGSEQALSERDTPVWPAGFRRRGLARILRTLVKMSPSVASDQPPSVVVFGPGYLSRA